ncbi:hypothetical protein EMIT07CA2_10485 [Brevibacillus sp. IT-7CA2]
MLSAHFPQKRSEKWAFIHTFETKESCNFLLEWTGLSEQKGLSHMLYCTEWGEMRGIYYAQTPRIFRQT